MERPLLLENLPQVTFDDAAIYFSEEQWQNLEDFQKKIYKELIKEIYETMVALGYRIPKPEIVSRIERGEEPCINSNKKVAKLEESAAEGSKDAGPAIKVERESPEASVQIPPSEISSSQERNGALCPRCGMRCNNQCGMAFQWNAQGMFPGPPMDGNHRKPYVPPSPTFFNGNPLSPGYNSRGDGMSHPTSPMAAYANAGMVPLSPHYPGYRNVGDPNTTFPFPERSGNPMFGGYELNQPTAMGPPASHMPAPDHEARSRKDPYLHAREASFQERRNQMAPCPGCGTFCNNQCGANFQWEQRRLHHGAPGMMEPNRYASPPHPYFNNGSNPSAFPNVRPALRHGTPPVNVPGNPTMMQFSPQFHGYRRPGDPNSPNILQGKPEHSPGHGLHGSNAAAGSPQGLNQGGKYGVMPANTGSSHRKSQSMSPLAALETVAMVPANKNLNAVPRPLTQTVTSSDIGRGPLPANTAKKPDSWQHAIPGSKTVKVVQTVIPPTSDTGQFTVRNVHSSSTRGQDAARVTTGEGFGVKRPASHQPSEIEPAVKKVSPVVIIVDGDEEKPVSSPASRGGHQSAATTVGGGGRHSASTTPTASGGGRQGLATTPPASGGGLQGLASTPSASGGGWQSAATTPTAGGGGRQGLASTPTASGGGWQNAATTPTRNGTPPANGGGLQSSAGTPTANGGGRQSSAGTPTANGGGRQSSAGTPTANGGGRQSSAGTPTANGGGRQSSAGTPTANGGGRQSSAGTPTANGGGRQSSVGTPTANAGGQHSAATTPTSKSGSPPSDPIIVEAGDDFPKAPNQDGKRPVPPITISSIRTSGIFNPPSSKSKTPCPIIIIDDKDIDGVIVQTCRNEAESSTSHTPPIQAKPTVEPVPPPSSVTKVQLQTVQQEPVSKVPLQSPIIVTSTGLGNQPLPVSGNQSIMLTFPVTVASSGIVLATPVNIADNQISAVNKANRMPINKNPRLLQPSSVPLNVTTVSANPKLGPMSMRPVIGQPTGIAVSVPPGQAKPISVNVNQPGNIAGPLSLHNPNLQKVNGGALTAVPVTAAGGQSVGQPIPLFVDPKSGIILTGTAVPSKDAVSTGIQNATVVTVNGGVVTGNVAPVAMGGKLAIAPVNVNGLGTTTFIAVDGPVGIGNNPSVTLAGNPGNFNKAPLNMNNPTILTLNGGIGIGGPQPVGAPIANLASVTSASAPAVVSGQQNGSIIITKFGESSVVPHSTLPSVVPQTLPPADDPPVAVVERLFNCSECCEKFNSLENLTSHQVVHKRPGATGEAASKDSGDNDVLPGGADDDSPTILYTTQGDDGSTVYVVTV